MKLGRIQAIPQSTRINFQKCSFFADEFSEITDGKKKNDPMRDQVPKKTHRESMFFVGKKIDQEIISKAFGQIKNRKIGSSFCLRVSGSMVKKNLS